MITLVVCPRKTISQRPLPTTPPSRSLLLNGERQAKKSAKSAGARSVTGRLTEAMISRRDVRSLAQGSLLLSVRPSVRRSVASPLSLSGIRIRFYFLSNKFRRPIVAWRRRSPVRSSFAAGGRSFICKCNRAVHPLDIATTDTGAGGVRRRRDRAAGNLDAAALAVIWFYDCLAHYTNPFAIAHPSFDSSPNLHSSDSRSLHSSRIDTI